MNLNQNSMWGRRRVSPGGKFGIWRGEIDCSARLPADGSVASLRGSQGHRPDFTAREEHRHAHVDKRHCERPCERSSPCRNLSLGQVRALEENVSRYQLVSGSGACSYQASPQPGRWPASLWARWSLALAIRPSGTVIKFLPDAPFCCLPCSGSDCWHWMDRKVNV